MFSIYTNIFYILSTDTLQPNECTHIHIGDGKTVGTLSILIIQIEMSGMHYYLKFYSHENENVMTEVE